MTRTRTIARCWTSAAAFVLAGFAVVVPAAGAQAAAPTPVISASGSSTEVREALDELSNTGRLSAAGRRKLLRHPEVAAQVVDPEVVTTGSAVVPDSAVPSSVRALASRDGQVSTLSTYCGAWRDVWANRYTALGFLAYRFHQYMQWCYNYSSVTSIQNRYPYISNNDGLNYYRGLIANSRGPVPAGEVYSFMQGHMENCIAKYGCISSTYPWTKIWAGNNGSSKYAAGL